MANEYVGTNYAAPQKEVGDVVDYRDRQNRKQRGEVLRIEAHFTKRGKLPLIVYTLRHPTYRNTHFHTTEEAFI